MPQSPLEDDDRIMAFKAKGEGRQRAFTVSWGALKAAIGALIPTVQGPRGDPGKDGTNGKDGAAGKSAYDLAAGNGFSGTLVQWLASLRGADGKDGTAGKDGANGKNGVSPRIERYTGTVAGTAGVATITWSKAFATPPLGKVIDGWGGTGGTQQITGRVTETTTTSAKVAVRRSKGVLILSDGPFEIAPAGTTIEIEVSGS